MKTKNANAKTENSNITTVKTSYARAAIVLLALNFCLTTYAVLALNNTTQEQLDTQTEVNGLKNTVPLKATQPSPEGESESTVQTRDQE